MTDKHYESLSALMDNEADELELRRILKEMEAESGQASILQGKWHRYHVVSASLKREIHSLPSSSLLASIQAELADEPTPARDTTETSGKDRVHGVSGSAGKSVLQLLGQGAIAASMALAVLFTADLVMVAENTNTGSSAVELAGNAGSRPLRGLTGELNPSTPTQVAVQNSLDEEDLRRLERVVSAELEDSLETPELPATFVPPASR